MLSLSSNIAINDHKTFCYSFWVQGYFWLYIDSPIGSGDGFSKTRNFYSASALLVMQTGVITKADLSVRQSVRLSVCPSVTFRCFVQTNKDTIMRFSLSGRTIMLVSGEVKVTRKFAGDHPQRGR